jgi:hypothetical protein
MTISTRIIRRTIVVAAVALASAVLAPAGQAWRADGPDGRVERPALQTMNSGMLSKSLIEAHYNKEARDAQLASGSLTRALIHSDGPDGRVERAAQPLTAADASGFELDDAIMGAALGFGFAVVCVAFLMLLRRRPRLASS